MSYVDRMLVCRDCGSRFPFTAGEQAFYAGRGFLNDPARCCNCRNLRKPGAEPAAHRYVHYGPFASFGGRSPRQMHPATCGRCGQMTEVPFLPRGDRAVFCPECFNAVRSQPAERRLPPPAASECVRRCRSRACRSASARFLGTARAPPPLCPAPPAGVTCHG